MASSNVYERLWLLNTTSEKVFLCHVLFTGFLRGIWLINTVFETLKYNIPSYTWLQGTITHHSIILQLHLFLSVRFSILCAAEMKPSAICCEMVFFSIV